MEILALLFVWPFLVLAFGLVFIAFADLSLGGLGVLGFFIAMLGVLGAIARTHNKKGVPRSSLDQLKELRQVVVILSISGLLPIFVRYSFDAFERSLAVAIFGLAIGFGLMLWGMFVPGHKVIMYSTIIGGALVVVYTYSQLWELGDAARVAAAAFGLVIATVVSIIKLKDKLT